MIRVICLLIGYVCGLFQTAYLYGKWKGIDIRQHGSGNSGTTNALRVMGMKAGAIVFLGDVAKVIVAMLAAHWILLGGAPLHQGPSLLWMLYAGFGAVLGHNYPFYLGFRGGKGIAVTAGVILMLDGRITLACLVAFVAVVLVTRYISLGSLVVVSLFFLLWVILGQTGGLGLSPELLPESYGVVFLWAALAFWRHRSNLARLAKGTENKFGSKKKE